MTTPAPPHTCPICGREVSRGEASRGEASRGEASRGEAPRSEGEPRPAPLPFCSPACKLVDLGRWLDGGYRIPGPAADEQGHFGGEDE
jgi:endogenous inhibitor of DNA gyrase (YacG/DUF329 family)